MKIQLYNAYQYCLSIANNHYENFPVASKFIPKHLRYAIAAVYAFARSADDFADEGNLQQEQRLYLLEHYVSELDCIQKSLSTSQQSDYFYTSSNEIFTALADVIRQFKIPIALFYDLLNAFKQDVHGRRYRHFNDIMAYCRLSANPVGRILLYLNDSVTEQNLQHSDALCTGLQLINFYQDISQDMKENKRLYIALDDLQQFSVSEDDIQENINNEHTQALLNRQLERAQSIYNSGKPLCLKLSGRFALELRMIYSGGQLILNHLKNGTDNIYQRPRLSHTDKVKILWQAIFFK